MKKFIASIALLIAATPAMADRYKSYEVTITNATTHQVITPPLLTTHNQHFSLFSVGSTASNGLRTLAETGNPQELNQEIINERGVQDVIAASAPILYGQSASFTIKGAKSASISLAAMLATTNDAFAALNAVSLPKKSATYYAYAFDAGTEMNNESCAYIPGPPCAPTSGNLQTESGEGFISIHNGIHGGSDLNPKHLDWRGPVAVIRITRIDG